MAQRVPLSDLGPRLVYFFGPSGRWGQCIPEDLLFYLERIDFGQPDCQASDLYIGQLGPISGDAYAGDIIGLAFGEREFSPDDLDAYLVTIDWHGTPTYFIGRGCKRPNVMKMDVMDIQPVIRVIAGMDVPEVRAFFIDGLEQAESTALEPEGAPTPRKGFFARLFGA